MRLRKLLYGLIALLATSLVWTLSPQQAQAALVASDHVYVRTVDGLVDTGLTKKQIAQIRSDANLVRGFTKVRGGVVSFDSAGATRAGMSPAFADAYAQALQHQVTSTPILARHATKGDTLDCLISYLGMTVATAAFVMAVVASAEAFALAAVGFGLSGISLVRSCY